MNHKIVIDVRSPMEFMGGNVAESINIPLQEIPQRVDEIKEMHSPIILCCASGARSENATQYLASRGIECENGGGWLEVNSQLQSLEIK
jgi:rhodanese-related sulfurtransferase